MADNILNRGDIISTISAETELPAARVDAVLKSFEAAIARKLAEGGEVRLAGFLGVKTSNRAARVSRNPRTGEPVGVPARTVARITPGKSLKLAAEQSGAPKKKGGKAAAKAPAAKAAPAKAAPAKAAPAKAAAKAPAAKAAPAKAAPAKAAPAKAAPAKAAPAKAAPAKAAPAKAAAAKAAPAKAAPAKGKRK